MIRAAVRVLSNLVGCCALLLSCVVRSDAQTPPSDYRPLRPPLEKFIAQMAYAHGFDIHALRALFAQVQTSQGVVKAIGAPSTSKSWYEFKPLFVDAGRISGGVKYWNENAGVLARAHSEFGVPESVIVALIGIETRYGRNTGGYRVLDALTTLAFDWPARGDFFRGELEEFLLLCREQNWDPLTVKGSFAGAMGLAQFMPGSYRRHGIDFDGDGRIDLWTNSADVIGSVGSYLRSFGWKEGQPIVAPARIENGDPRPLLEIGLKPSLTLDQWRARGARPLSPMPDALNASLFSLDLIGGAEYWFGFDNFYALLQYNRSRNYVMAIYELSIEITREKERLAVTGGSSDASPELELR
jgi:membrane-bound lytic murein transglycosylase B